ncbi:MAG: alpha-amylase family glycosyl hydrolase [Candidatus Muiribacteriota bacterium]
MKWYENAQIYHIFPLGYCGCEKTSIEEINFKFEKILDEVDYLKETGFNTILFGPVFESSSHGYDVVDMRKIDNRLGDNFSVKAVVEKLKNSGFKIIFDAVFNHCGRNNPFFQDLLINRENSKYKNWFYGVDFSNNNKYNDGFSYYGWNGDISLVKYNLSNEEVVDYLLNSVKYWVDYFDIDGLRLDAADSLDINFIEELRIFSSGIKSDFWLMGEVVHGDYRNWLGDNKLHSVTNYECYKGLFSSHNDKNYFEIAYSLNRLFGHTGIYKDYKLYNFIDNHDVSRINSVLNSKEHLFPLLILLFTIPGIPSFYYGSEFENKGEKNGNDWILRPELSLNQIHENSDKHIVNVIKKLSSIRKNLHALKNGNYSQLMVSHQQFFFTMKNENHIITGVNSQNKKVSVKLKTGNLNDNRIFRDCLNDDREYIEKNGVLKVDLNPNWGVILEQR